MIFDAIQTGIEATSVKRLKIFDYPPPIPWPTKLQVLVDQCYVCSTNNKGLLLKVG